MNAQDFRSQTWSRDGQSNKEHRAPFSDDQDDRLSSRYQLLLLESMVTLLVGYQLYISEPHPFQTAALLCVMLLTGMLLVVPEHLVRQQDIVVWMATLNSVALLLSSFVGHTFETATALGLIIITMMVSYSQSRAHLMLLGTFICVVYAGLLHYVGLWDTAHFLVLPVIGSMLIIYGCRGSGAPVLRPSSAKNQSSAYEKGIDTLTGLLNRSQFIDRVERIIRYCRMNPNFRFAIAFLDLDNFKPINDRLGHKAGDLVLQRVAQRLKARLKSGDMAGRYGGDEFVLLINDVHSHHDVSRVVERILTAVQEPIDVGTPVQVGASIGITLSTNVHAHAEDLIRDADAAMYRAKAQGKNRYEISDHIHDTPSTEVKSRLRRLLHTWVD